MQFITVFAQIIQTKQQFPSRSTNYLHAIIMSHCLLYLHKPTVYIFVYYADDKPQLQTWIKVEIKIINTMSVTIGIQHSRHKITTVKNTMFIW